MRLQLEKKGEQELENWLRYLLSKNADFEFYKTEIDGKHVELMRIHKALNEPVAFLIKEAINKGLIKVLDPNTAPRYMKYIPIWA